ncbi:Crp/Fnr family transcriptional regulator [Listeria valentina]|uniref:Crp/Fnr family transcriptional regulator n=1 Tax=Listeria valentina TaxID=2705293 RepID=UPI0014315AC9|nr:Crp/Fnr family transcriptional regulator [Listeria valentina]
MYRKEIKKEATVEDIIQELEQNALNREQVQRKEYNKGDRIEEDYGRVIILKQGYIIKFMHVKKQERTVSFYAGEALVDFDRVFVSKEENQFVLKALSKCELISVEKQYFLNYLSIRPVFTEFILKKLTRQLHQFVVKMGINGKYQRDRVLIGLINAAYALGADQEEDFYEFPTVINHYFLADYCDLDATAFSKICKKLVDERLILLKKRQIVIHLRKLRQAVKESQGVYM